jgi:hypothetical protein
MAMSNPSLALGNQPAHTDHESDDTVVVSEPVEQSESQIVCAATTRYLSDAKVSALREEVLHHDFMND